MDFFSVLDRSGPVDFTDFLGSCEMWMFSHFFIYVRSCRFFRIFGHFWSCGLSRDFLPFFNMSIHVDFLAFLEC